MSALAEVHVLPRKGFYPTVLEAIRPGESIWSRWPAGEQQLGSMFFHPDDAARIVAQGWIVLDGKRAKTSYELPSGYYSPIVGWVPACPYTVRLEFEERFREHP